MAAHTEILRSRYNAAMLRHKPLPFLAALWLAVPSPAQGDVGKPLPKPDTQTARVYKLIVQLADDKRHADAARQLQRIGEPAVKPLLEAIGTEEDEIQANDKTRRALNVLGKMGTDAKEAYDPLASAVGNCNPKIYILVLHTIGTLAPYTETKHDARSFTNLVQASMNVYRRLDANERRYYSTEYQRFRQRIAVDPDAGLDAMIREVRSNITHRREVAAEVLGRMGPKAKKALSALAMGLRHATRRGSRQRVAVVRRQGSVLRSGRSPTSRDTFAATAAEAILKINPRDPKSAPAWAYRLQHGALKTERAQAALMIGSFGEKAKGQVSALIKALKDRSKQVRCEVITALGMIGPDASAAVPNLLELGASEDQAIAVRAKAALKQISKKDGKPL